MDFAMKVDPHNYTTRSEQSAATSSPMDTPLPHTAESRHDSMVDAHSGAIPECELNQTFLPPSDTTHASPLCFNQSSDREWPIRRQSPESNASLMNAIDSAPTNWMLPSPPNSDMTTGMSMTMGMSLGSINLPAIDATMSGYDQQLSTSIAEEMPIGSLVNTQYGSFGFDAATFGSYTFDNSFRPGSHMEYNTPPSSFGQAADPQSEALPMFQRQRIVHRPTSQLAFLRNSIGTNGPGQEMSKAQHDFGLLPSPCSSLSQSLEWSARSYVPDSQASRPIQIQMAPTSGQVNAVLEVASPMSQSRPFGQTQTQYAIPPTPGPASRKAKAYCWEHGCNGREFSTSSNLLRHQREKDGTAIKAYCPGCGAQFTRTTARNGHLAHGKCTNRPTSQE